MSTALEEDLIQRLVQGTCADPFSLLGPHASPEGLMINAFLPDATRVIVLDKDSGSGLLTLKPSHYAGFFSGTLPPREQPYRYQLAVEWGDYRQVIEDPYRFGLLLREMDGWLLSEGTHLRPYEQLGAHPMRLDDVDGTAFAVWAPNAQRVSVIGEFNYWDGRCHPMRLRAESGIWELFLPHVEEGRLYKYEIIDADGQTRLKADPYAFDGEIRPETASRTAVQPPYTAMPSWRQQANGLSAPMSIYEVHLGSWQRGEGGQWLSYRELAERLIPYVKWMGFTHIELLPIHEHPFDGSWGYQPVGLYAPTRRFGSPDDFRYLIDCAHKEGINVLLDWVPGHFPNDEHGLIRFDGTELYEYADPREGFHQDWNTLIYNYDRHEVHNYLTGNALYWLERFGLDGLRVDAVASMLYRDYSRAAGEWVPNRYGGRENLEAIEFLRTTNKTIGAQRQVLP